MNAIHMLRLQYGHLCKEHQESILTVNKFERQISRVRKSIKSDKYHLNASTLTLFVITASWVFGTLQSIFVWGGAIPFGVIWLIQGFLHLTLIVLKYHCKNMDQYM